MKRKPILFFLLFMLTIIVTNVEARADDSIYENTGELVIETDVVKGYAFVDHCYEIMKGGTYTVSMADGITRTNDVILIDADDPVTLILDNVNISSDAFKMYYAGSGAYGTPAVWIDTNLDADVTIIYKGSCYLRGTNQWSAIMKYNSRPGGKLTVKPSGSDDDILNLEAQAGYGIGSHSDDPSCSRDVIIEGGKIHGSIGAEGVVNYVINDGYHLIEKTSSTTWRVYEGLGPVTINGGTVISSGCVDSSVVTYNGGNFYSKEEVKVVDKNGDEAKLVVFPAGADLTGVEIDGTFSPCSSTKETEYQLYTFLSKKKHKVALIYGSKREEYVVTFDGERPKVSGGVDAKYPEWAHISIKKAVLSGVPEEVKFTGKRIILDELKVTLDGVELNPGYDYIVEYSDNKYSGEAKFTVRGINTFKDTCSGRFKIVRETKEPVIRERTDITGAKVSGVPDCLIYTGPSPILSDLKVTLGNKVLVYNRDYTVYYSDINYGDIMSYTIRGIYDYKGDIKGQVNIKKAEADEEAAAALKKPKITGISEVSRKTSDGYITFTLKIKWKKSAGANGYYIMYKAPGDETLKNIANVKGTSGKVKIKIKESMLGKTGIFYVTPYVNNGIETAGKSSSGKKFVFS